MGGGLIQLVAFGSQDAFLTSNPQITYFKSVFRRYSPFAVESLAQTFNGTVGFGNEISCTISRNGDLINKMYLEIDLPTHAAGYVDSVGHALVKSVEFQIGGQKIDKITSEWLDIRDQLYMSSEKQLAADTLVGRTNLESGDSRTLTSGCKLYVDLPFWFTQSPGMALPIIALQYHECKVNIELEKASTLVVSGNGPTTGLDVKLWVDYVYLETSERRKMAQNSHEFLITQLQHTGAESVPAKATSMTHRLNLNHPVKELIWAFRKEGNPKFQYNDAEVSDVADVMGQGDVMKECRLLLNGHDRFPAREGKYFRLVQPMMHHTNVPTKGVYCYSFALRPEQEQPSGTLNFSRIDSAQFKFELATNDSRDLLVFALNYNVLRIMSGMGGLSFSN